jgi:hypothetical protein
MKTDRPSASHFILNIQNSLALCLLFLKQIYKLDYQFEFKELFFYLLVTFNSLIYCHHPVRHFHFLHESLLNPFR